MMDLFHRIHVFGDSILRGVQWHPVKKRYVQQNDMDIPGLCDKLNITVDNHASFGCTVQKGETLLKRFLAERPDCTAVLMDFGGNDCDFDWQAIGENPEGEHQPHTPIAQFSDIYISMIKKLQALHITPILTTLPPLDPQRFFDWFCRLNPENVLRWLGSINTIYRFQENYSHTVERIAASTGALLIDLRGAFLKHRRIEHLLCEDGIHPNSEGQHVISQTFLAFGKSRGLTGANF